MAQNLGLKWSQVLKRILVFGFGKTPSDCTVYLVVDSGLRENLKEGEIYSALEVRIHDKTLKDTISNYITSYQKMWKKYLKITQLEIKIVSTF